MGRRQVRAASILCGAAVAGMLSPAAAGFSLLGGCRSIACFAGGEFAQPFDQEFRWPIAHLTVAADTSFLDAYGTGGFDALGAALDRWEDAFSTDPSTAPSDTREPAREVGIVYDLESVIVHEIGHALGLGHPDRAAAGGKNFGADGSPIPTTGTEVMFSGTPNGALVRELTSDEIAGVRYVYDVANVNPMDGAGVGQIRFERVAAGEAAWGTALGANIDLFATSNSERPGTFYGGALATTAISMFAVNLQTDPGIINGEFVSAPVVAGVDVYINTDRPILLLHPVPEPSFGIILLLGAGSLRKRSAADRRRRTGAPHR